MYKLFWCPRTASQAPMAVLEEIGADYRLELVDTKTGRHRTAGFLRINPCGFVPALLTEEGRPLFESAAIIMHLCDRHPDAGLAPPPEHGDRAYWYQWMVFMADTVFPAYKRFYYSGRYSTDEADAPKINAKALEDLLGAWQIVDDALAADGPFLLGQRFSACDIYMQMFTLWSKPPEALYQRFANVARCAATVAARPAVARAREKHGR